MSEPKTKASKIEKPTPDVLHWSVHDDRIDSRSEAYAVRTKGGGAVLVDPLPLEEDAIADLGGVEAILMTSGEHQRSSWRYRKRFGAKVYAPKDAEGLEEQPDAWYGPNETLPGGLKAIHCPGVSKAHYALLLEREEGVLFCADVLLREGNRLRFLPDEYQTNRKQTEDSARRFLDLRFGILCCAHGEPWKDDPHAAIKKTLGI